MTKNDICKEIQAKTGFDRKSIMTIIDAFMEVVKETVSKKTPVFLRGFGTFSHKRRAKKTARDISKNVTVIVPEHDIPHFKPSVEFEKMVKKG